MEVEAVERQKLVSNDEETNELNEIVSHNASSSQNTVQNIKTPISPVLSENTSKNSSKINSETKFSYQNERRYDFKAAKKRIPKDDTESSSSSNNIIEFEPSSKNHLDETQNGSCTSSTTLKVNNNVICSSNPKLKTDSLKKNLSKSNLQSFEDRQLKHHSFISELPDVRHMEKALLKLLEDFHSGKLRAFGSGQCMDQMKKIREQQEQLARLHFDLGSEQMSQDSEQQTSEDKQKLLIEQLQQLSFSIEKLNSSTSDV